MIYRFSYEHVVLGDSFVIYIRDKYCTVGDAERLSLQAILIIA